MANDNTYWNSKGAHEVLYEKLTKLIPIEGEVPNGRSTNKHLEKLRRACNCYYDLFNNGLGNRAAEFNRVFGFSGTWIAKARFPYCHELEQAMDRFILAAAKEQGVEVTDFDRAIFDIAEHGKCLRREVSTTQYYVKNGIKITYILPVAY